MRPYGKLGGMANRTPLIQTDELAAALASDVPPLVLDVRWSLAAGADPRAYAAGHIPGAVFVDLDDAFSAPPGPEGRHPLPDAATFQQAMRAAGVTENRPVITYDAGDHMPAARAWWTLRYYGHPDVRVLDGGYRAWTESGLTADTVPATPPPGTFTATPGGMPLLDAPAAARLARTGILLDARAPERYRGETEPIDPVAGHIPGAVNAPTTSDTTESGHFRPAADLSAHYATLGVTPATQVGTYCGSGISAARQLLALTTAGIPAALYVGSWSNWLTDPDRPVATG